MSHTVHPLVHTFWPVSVHSNESLTGFKASDFCYTTDTGPSLGLLLAILLMPCVAGVPAALDLRVWPLHVLQQLIDEVGVGLRL